MANGWTQGLHHVGITVTNLEVSKGFYTEVFGLEVVGEQPGVSAFLSDGTNMITLWQTAEQRASVAVAGLHHLAFRVPTLAALQEVERRLQARGAEIQFDGLGEYGRLVGMFFYDPDGVRLEAALEHGHGQGLPTIGGCGAL